MNALTSIERDDSDRTEAAVLDAARAVIAPLDSSIREQVSARKPIEERWLENIRAYLGRYDDKKAGELQKANQSTAFVKLTRHKTNGWSARISDLLFPTDGKNWGTSPTPIPTLTGKAKEAEAAARSKVEEANRAADAGDPTAAQIAEQAGGFAEQVRTHLEAIEEAKRRAEWMERTIEDQLVESDYVTQCRDVIEDGCKLGTGILKGPTTVQSLRSKWAQDPATTLWKLQQDPDPRPTFNRVDPWHFFPDMSARTIKEAEFTFERSLPSKKDLRRGALKFGFNRAAVRRLLEEGPPQTTSTDLSHIAELRAMTGESEPIRNRYIMWEYHGPLECDQICALIRATQGDDAARNYEEQHDPIDEKRVIIWFIGNEVLKIAPEFPLDSGDSLYSVWNFEKSEASIFGYGVPEIISDSQTTLNNAWRMMQDNGALAVGPQMIFDKGAVEPENGKWGLTPMKAWLRSTTAYSSPQNKPFEFFTVPSNQAEYAGIIQLAKGFADEESSMPDIAQGEQGAATQTLGGMSMLFNSANVVFRRVVKSWDDDLTKPTIRRAYDWNMQFNNDDSIKGDMQVDARGTSVLLVREIQSQNLMAVTERWSASPILGPYVKVRDAAAKTLQTMMIPPEDVLHSEEDVERKAAEAAQQQPEMDPVLQVKMQIAQLEAETREKIAQMQYDAAIARLSADTGRSEEELRAKYELEHSKLGHAERMKATDVAIEQAREDRGLDVGEGIG